MPSPIVCQVLPAALLPAGCKQTLASANLLIGPTPILWLTRQIMPAHSRLTSTKQCPLGQEAAAPHKGPVTPGCCTSDWQLLLNHHCHHHHTTILVALLPDHRPRRGREGDRPACLSESVMRLLHIWACSIICPSAFTSHFT